MLKILAVMTDGTLTASLPCSLAVGRRGSIPEAWAAGAWRWFIFTGFRGGFTTFSTCALETTRLFTVEAGRSAQFSLGITNITGARQVFLAYRFARRGLPAA